MTRRGKGWFWGADAEYVGGDVSGYKVSLGNLGHKGIDRGRTSKTGDEIQPMGVPRRSEKKRGKKREKIEEKNTFL